MKRRREKYWDAVDARWRRRHYRHWQGLHNREQREAQLRDPAWWYAGVYESLGIKEMAAEAREGPPDPRPLDVVLADIHAEIAQTMAKIQEGHAMIAAKSDR